MSQNLGNLFISAESGFVDDTGRHTLSNSGTTLGAPKFGNNSILFANTGSRLSTPNHPDFSFAGLVFFELTTERFL